MNNTEKIASLLLGGALAWYLFFGMPRQAARVEEHADTRAVAETAQVAVPQRAKPEEPAAEPAAPAVPSAPEKTVALENAEFKVELSSWGAVVKKATLKEYARGAGEVSEDNPPVELDFSPSPLGGTSGVAGLAPNAAFEIVSSTQTEAVFANAAMRRKISIADGYRISVEDEYAEPAAGAVSIGAVSMGGSKNDLLSVDSMLVANEKGKPEAVHHCEGDSPLKPYLAGGLSGGCGGSSAAAGTPAVVRERVRGAQKWIALKNRFFVVALCSSDAEIGGFSAAVERDRTSASYRPGTVYASAEFSAPAKKRAMLFYAGPKRQSLLWDLGMRDVMEFGMWRWLCYPLVSVLNFFHSALPNYGVAIVLLTVLVRLLFWPLTHKSTVGMRKMQELQPKMKEIQAKFKDNPQRLQQETWALYREQKVNPLSSCLPMLVQIPVFIALFNVLRSAVELRYAPFLWISDLSEPEGLFAEYLPFGGLNVLPILMAVSTGLQSAFTPTAGDRTQQRMMTVMMPAMMLVMFYSFPSALSLYWFLSNLFSIAQMWLIRRRR